MGKTKERYTVEEAAEILKLNRQAVLILLAAIRSDFDPLYVRKVRTRELERMYQMIRPPGRDPQTP